MDCGENSVLDPCGDILSKGLWGYAVNGLTNRRSQEGVQTDLPAVREGQVSCCTIRILSFWNLTTQRLLHNCSLFFLGIPFLDTKYFLKWQHISFVLREPRKHICVLTWTRVKKAVSLPGWWHGDSIRNQSWRAVGGGNWGSSCTHLHIFVSIDPTSAEVVKGWWFDFKRQWNSF